MSWFVYIIRCSDASLYTGITTDVAGRYLAHAGQNGAKYFRSRRPEAVIYLESGHDRSTASRREAAIKKLSKDGKRNLVGSPLNELE